MVSGDAFHHGSQPCSKEIAPPTWIPCKDDGELVSSQPTMDMEHGEERSLYCSLPQRPEICNCSITYPILTDSTPLLEEETNKF